LPVPAGASSPASAAYFGIVEAFTPETIQRQFDVNVFGQMRVSRAFLPAMRERRSGLVAYVTSVVGRYTVPFGGVYEPAVTAINEATAPIQRQVLENFGLGELLREVPAGV
jgi:NAD(P)-dependent dehydrogenase (short-subunit alcohol dehydrogenase family)